MHLYLKRDPQRTLILVTNSDDETRLNRPRRALVFRAAEDAKVNSQATVEFLRKEDVDLTSVIRLTQYEVKGCLGLISVGGELFLAIVTSAGVIGNPIPNAARHEQVSKIQEVAFFSLNTNTYDDPSLVSNAPTSPTIGAYELNDSYDRDGFGQQMQGPQPVYEHPCAALSKIMSSGTFYYASDGKWDISTRLQVRTRRQAQYDHSVFDPRFIWNGYIVESLMDFRSRLDSNERDELDACHFIDGNVANFVETETLFSTSDASWSYVQIRGSIPLFWEQQGLQIGGQRIQITRAQGASQPAFERHFAQLIEEYENVHIINLLGTKENETTLTAAYTKHLQTLRASGNSDVGMSNFDFHGVVRMMGHDAIPTILKSLEGIQNGLENYGFATVEHACGALRVPQVGVFRTNCLDCLDDTNIIQDIISRLNLKHYLRVAHRDWAFSESLWTCHRELSAENGDALSRIYAGTGALNTSFTRTGRRTFAGLLADATKSVARIYINHFQDKGTQAAIDLLLGNMNAQRQVTIFDPIHDSVRAALAQRLPEYSSPHKCQIFVGTWNLNGKPPTDKLMTWLFPRSDSTEPDLFVLGFQEIVPLTAQQIVQTDPEKKSMWEDYILDTLATRRDKNTEYVVLRSEQLVGTALIVLCKAGATGYIRNVEAATKKTGLGGMSGNKGAVGIRLDYYDSSFCFITAHLAAGHVNVEERNSDYRTIANGLSFLRGKVIASHENVIWLADTNYRIDLANDVVRYLVVNDQLDALHHADQLKLAMDSGLVFTGYKEGPILFRPTYRYDLNSNNYDIPEKQCIPAWTDRVLYRGAELDLMVYNRAELKQSNHRPVYAIFNATPRAIDIAKKHALQSRLLSQATHANIGQTWDEKSTEMTTNTKISRGPPGPRPPRFPVQSLQYNAPNSPEDTPSSSEEELYRATRMIHTDPTLILNSTIRARPVEAPGNRSRSGSTGRRNDTQTVQSQFEQRATGAHTGMETPSHVLPGSMASYTSNGDVFDQLVAHGCTDMTPKIDPNGYSAVVIFTGGFGDVWKGHLIDGTEVAVKTWRFSTMSQANPKYLKRAMREVYNWSKAKHENVQELLGVVMFQGRLGMVSPWMPNGNLREYIIKHPDANRYALCAQVATGLSYLHGEGMVHGDLKAANILVSKEGTPKISDFDHSILTESTLAFSNTTNTAGGTLRWMAPELFTESDDQSVKRNKQTDIYALGMTCLEIITGQLPYSECKGEFSLLRALQNKTPPRCPEALAVDNAKEGTMWKLLLRCWDHEPTSRPGASDILMMLSGLASQV